MDIPKRREWHQKIPNLLFRGAAFASFCTATAFFFSLLALKQVNVTMIIAKNSRTNATHKHQIASPKYARLPDLSRLTWWRKIPNKLKSVAITIRHKIQATNAAKTPKRDPIVPAPMDTIQAMKATPQAMGCRIMARVRLSEVPASMSESWVRSVAAITCAGS